MRLWYGLDATLARVECLWRGALKLWLYSLRRLWDDPKALYLAPLHVRPYGGVAFVGITHLRKSRKGKGVV